MTKVLHVGKFFPPFAGGIENFLADLLPAQWERGDQAYALVHAHEAAWNPWPALVPDPAFEHVYRAPCYGRLLYAPVSPQFPWWLNRLIKRLQPDLLHLHMPNTSVFWALLLPAARRIPWVVHWHADVVASLVDKRLAVAYSGYRPFEQAVLKRSAAVLVTSPPYLESSDALHPWRDKCHVVPLGLARTPSTDEAARVWVEQEWGGHLRVLSVGRLTYYKGFEYLIRAAAQVDRLELRIVGHGELRPRLQQLIDDLGVGERIKLLGFCESARLGALFHTCDCFALASLERTEAFGVVLMEAMGCGKPALACAIPGSGVGWVVQDGATGLLAPPADAEGFAASLRRLRDDAELRGRLGQAARERFDAEFRIERVAAQTEEVYRQSRG